MEFFSLFLSVIIVTRNQSEQIKKILTDVTHAVSTLARDYEIIIIDNGSEDDSVSVLKALTGPDGLPNLQVYALTKQVDADVAAWVGLENSLGDFVAVIDPLIDDINFLPEMLDKAAHGADIVFANNKQKPKQSLAYRSAFAAFNRLYQLFNDVNLAKEAPQYRILSKRVINFILQHPRPEITYRHLPAMGGFSRVSLNYSVAPQISHTIYKGLGESINRGVRLLVSTTQGPMRLVTSLSLFGAASNFFYSLYVMFIAIFKSNVAPGWVSLSLQQAGMFFLISLVLLVLGEYILHMTRLSNEGPLYNIAQEFISTRLVRREKLNIEEVNSTPIHRAAHVLDVI